MPDGCTVRSAAPVELLFVGGKDHVAVDNFQLPGRPPACARVAVKPRGPGTEGG